MEEKRFKNIFKQFNLFELYFTQSSIVKNIFPFDKIYKNFKFLQNYRIMKKTLVFLINFLIRNSNINFMV